MNAQAMQTCAYKSCANNCSHSSADCLCARFAIPL